MISWSSILIISSSSLVLGQKCKLRVVQKYDFTSPAQSTNALTYQRATEICSSKGEVVCSAGDICRGGVPVAGLDIFGTSDNWIAVGDSENQWITLNRDGGRLCKIHTQVTGAKPAWGTQTNAVGQGFTRSVKCCPKYDKKTLGFSGFALTYQQAVDVCTSKGQRVCSSTDICPGGVPNPLLDVFGGIDNWIAVGDSENQWITLNRGGGRLCKIHTQVTGAKPAWGTRTSAAGEGFTRAVKCCSQYDKTSEPSSQNALTYQQAVDVCSSKGQRVCSATDICPRGVPNARLDIFGTGDNWIAVDNAENQWITLNRAGGRLCKIHTQVTGAKPAWGTQSNASGEGFTRAVKCCSQYEQQSQPFSTNALTYQKAVEVCSSKGQRICSSSEICPGGVPNPLLDVFGSNDNWIAVGNSDNQWITLNRGGGRLCKIHTQVTGAKPAWGTLSNASAEGFTRSVKCCSQFDKQSQPFSSNALTYQNAVDVCSSKGERLCSSAEICPGGVPNPLLDVFGNEDNWIAVNNSENEWITFNRPAGRLCKIHTQVTGAKPAWGTQSNAAGQGFTRSVKCCPK